ncbi:protein PIP-1-like [Elephas maximus indicus]|uniref:protein PIP-1-like n=1 Tax=Elephas maximus indicus TaxID=99487 RepID=UPI0021172B0D|nr:protein PIP-1-like [Elephas maximus indicus]
MGKCLLLLLLGLSLLLGFLQGELLEREMELDTSKSTALKCYKCHFIGFNGTCWTKRTICQAQNDQQCVLKKFYGGNKFIFGTQTCGTTCNPTTIVYRDEYTYFSCCKDNLCNKF